ncbi:carboxylesterase notum2-like [Protopterus annectens]|uniref:carboxylesterase notum2-like n=1 Tax=Protopterus annectens TaxID=7888 RepID=UPI001CF98128|nr:carboxylesterase notum2-like [Protopterus annectens]
MRSSGLLVFLLLLAEVISQNKKSSKPHNKNINQQKKSSDVGEPETSATDGETTSVNLSSTEYMATQIKSLSLASLQKGDDDMKLFFLKNTLVTCNDGTAAGYYLREYKGSKRWLIFLEGGWCCYNKETCDTRYKTIRRLMSSLEWQQTRKGTGILSNQSDENPHWWNANAVVVPYCSSDVWSGTSAKSRQVEYSFMGSLIIREVIKDLIPRGIKQSKVVMLAGTSAGGMGVLLNIERVASLLEQSSTDGIQVRGLVDSGWFLDSKQHRQTECSDDASCSPAEVIKKGIKFWNGNIPEKCKQHFKKGDEWQCFFGYNLYSFLKSPIFVVQWLYDEEQLRVENIQLENQSLTEKQWNYIQNLGRELKNSLRDVLAVFAPSCLSHTLITNSNWMSFQVKGTNLARALQCWDKSLQENKTVRTPIKGCPFHLIDNCQWPHCNPTCPALRDPTTGQELNVMQLFTRMGLDNQKKSQELKSDPSHSMELFSNGG